MPVVPKLTRQVQATELPGVRLTAAATPESLGARDSDPIASALEGVGARTEKFGLDNATQIIDEETKRANQTAVLGAQTGLKSWTLTNLYDPNTGALTVKGKDAMGLPEKLGDAFNAKADEIEAGLSTPDQKMAFRKIRAEQAFDVQSTLQKHVYAEMQQYHGEETQAAVETSRNLAIASSDNPLLVARELGVQVQAIRGLATTMHWGPEQTQQQVDAAVSKTHVGVIEKMLADGKTKAADTYFDEMKGQINGDQIARIEKSLKEGTARADAQKQSDAIAAAGGSLTQQLDKARAIADPEVRDRTTEYLEHRFAVNEKAQRDDDEAASKAAFNILDKYNGDLSKIPPTTWASFSGATKSSLRSYGERLSSGETIETDWRTFYNLVDKAGTAPDDFAKLNLLDYRGKLGNTEFKQLADRQLSMRNKDDKPDPFAQFGSEEQVVNDSLRQYGYPTEPSKQSDGQQVAVAELRRRVREQVGLLKKKDITQKDVQSIVDNILSQKADVKGSWWGIVPFNGVPFFSSSKRAIDMTIGDVPQADKDQITASLNKRGKPVSDTTILDLYIRANANGTAK